MIFHLSPSSIATIFIDYCIVDPKCNGIFGANGAFFDSGLILGLEQVAEADWPGP